MYEQRTVGFDLGSDDKTVVTLHDRKGYSIIEPPEWAGNIVGVTQFKGEIIVACQGAVFRLQGTELVPMD